MILFFPEKRPSVKKKKKTRKYFEVAGWPMTKLFDKKKKERKSSKWSSFANARDKRRNEKGGILLKNVRSTFDQVNDYKV